MTDFLLVGFGGFLGSVARYLFGQFFDFKNIAFPISTLIINFIGSLIIGIVGFSVPNFTKPTLFLKVGLCGGFTTFSTFSLETFNMLKSGKTILALLYSFLSIALCLIGVLLGKLISKTFYNSN